MTIICNSARKNKLPKSINQFLLQNDALCKRMHTETYYRDKVWNSWHCCYCEAQFAAISVRVRVFQVLLQQQRTLFFCCALIIKGNTDDWHTYIESLVYPQLPTQRHSVWIFSNTQADLVTVTSHITYHTQVSSAFTCSSVQQGFYAAASVGRRGSKSIQRAQAETTGPCSPAAAAALFLAWWREAQGLLMEKSFRFQRVFFLPLPFLLYWIRANTNTTQRCGVCLLSHLEQNLNCVTKHPVCVSVFISRSPVQ